MIVWVSGVSGSDRTAYLEEVVRFATEQGQSARLLDFGRLLEEVPESRRVVDDVTNLLDRNPEVVRMHRLGALQVLEQRLKEAEKCDLVIVSTHTTFMRRRRFESALDMEFLKSKLAPRIDMFATVIDACHDTWSRLQKRRDWENRLRLVDVAVWRDVEITTTKMLAEYEGKSFYLLARSEPAEAAFRVFRSRGKKIYLSYPITNILKEKQHLLNGVRQLRDRLRQAGFVVFDPLAVQDHVETRKALGLPTEVPEEQEKEAQVYLSGQTVTRDFQFIEQADFVVVNYPTDTLSTGVMQEMTHARDVMRPVYLCGYPGTVGPFMEPLFREAFATPDELLLRLKQLYPDADRGAEEGD